MVESNDYPGVSMNDKVSMKQTVPTLDDSRFATNPVLLAPVVPVVAPLGRSLASRFASTLPEESLVIDDRSQISPAQMVENKLVNRLKELSMPVSHLQMRGLVRKRFDA